MSEGSDYDEGDWKGESFADARKDFEETTGRSYADAVNTGKKLDDVRVLSVETKCESPLIVVGDHTGSMGDWLKPIFAKLGLLANEAPTYLGKSMEISFCAIGDVYSDSYPLQVRPFGSGLALKDRLKELVFEKQGGPGICESYEQAALYYSRNFSFPKAIRKPVIVFIGDELPYDPVDVKKAEVVSGVKLDRAMTAKEIFSELRNKCAVYMVLKPLYVGRENTNPTNQNIYEKWVDLLGFKNVKVLEEADRVVDVILGILAEVTNRNDNFIDDMKRQTPAQRKTVYKSLDRNEDGTLKSENKDPEKKADDGGKSVLRVPSKKKKPGKLFK
ncbi:MAG: hypothetical protein HY226_05440 [Candidatus Vogelbacteria bacterium]|nr:hypothetical protein [Candidatus Vogelbacteria bacterium]